MDSTPDKTERLTAEQRAGELGMKRFCDLPTLAQEYRNHLCRLYGACGETLLTAYAHYAQAVEGLEAADTLYAISEEGRAWFAARLKKDIPAAVDSDRVLTTVLKVMNEAYAADPHALKYLFSRNAVCTPELVAHPTVQVRNLGDSGSIPMLNVLGLINGFVLPLTGKVIVYAKVPASAGTFEASDCPATERWLVAPLPEPVVSSGVTFQQISAAFQGTNFGPAPDYRRLLGSGLLCIDCGFSTGSTIIRILRDLKLIEGPGDDPVVTQLGKRFLMEVFYDRGC